MRAWRVRHRISCGPRGHASNPRRISTRRRPPCSDITWYIRLPSSSMPAPSPASPTNSSSATTSQNSSTAGGQSILATDNADKNPDLFRVIRGQLNRKQGAAVGSVGGGEGAAVLSDDAVRECEADAVAFGFRRKERNKDLLQIGGCDSRAVVTHLYYDSVTRPRRTDSHTSVRIRFGADANEIQQRQPQHAFVRASGQRGRHIDVDFHGQLVST